MSPHAEEIIISSRGKRVTLGGARSTPSIDRACERHTSDILRGLAIRRKVEWCVVSSEQQMEGVEWQEGEVRGKGEG